MTPGQAGQLTTTIICVAVFEGAVLKACYGRLVKQHHLPGDTYEWPEVQEMGQ